MRTDHMAVSDRSFRFEITNGVDLVSTGAKSWPLKPTGSSHSCKRFRGAEPVAVLLQ